MNIDQFVAMTLRVIGEDGLDGYLPTLVLPNRREVRCLEDIPQDVTHESAALDWAARTVQGSEDYFLAFAIDHQRLKAIARIRGAVSDRLVQVPDAT